MRHQRTTTDTSQDGKAVAERKSGYKDRFWIPRFWDGMNITAFFPLLVRNRFAVSLICVGMAFLIGGLSLINSLLWLIQAALFGRKIQRTKIEQDPIFCHRALALRHDSAARVAGARQTTHVPRHVRLLRARTIFSCRAGGCGRA